ncbi:hypothetical protein T4D_12311 [Trichinella pseudospiralis]|uniref:Uncharacterized protein n=1 Tax=Trichinella pseudospiralis TaxID=6337 RepID=A0A0V1DQC0_TRIPS|nr:hypothetical protein T4D_12311 [Trichinella pseudospiralis]
MLINYGVLEINRSVFSRYLVMYAIRRARDMFIDLPS